MAYKIHLSTITYYKKMEKSIPLVYDFFKFHCMEKKSFDF